MGWWDEDGYRVGDTVADYLTVMLKTIGQNRRFDNFMGCLLKSVNDNKNLFSDNEKLPATKITARLTGKKEITSNIYDLEEKISNELDQTLKTISEIFQSTFDELPSTGDFFANLEFVLSKPGEYFNIEPLPADSSLWGFKI